MKIYVITILPDIISVITSSAIFKRAFSSDLISLQLINPRDFCESSYKSIDEKPFGGGPGMVMSYQPLSKAISFIQESTQQKPYVIYPSPVGKLLNSVVLNRLTQHQEIIFVCGRYEGVDQRFIDKYVDEEVSIGDYILSGGELPTLVILEGLIRLLPQVLGNHESNQQESFDNSLLTYPQYTRPQCIEGMHVPEVLLSGNHKLIKQWKREQRLKRTYYRRPDLLRKAILSKEDQQFLNNLEQEHEQ